MAPKLKQLSSPISSFIREPCCLIAYKVLMNGAVGIFTVVLMEAWTVYVGGCRKRDDTCCFSYSV